MKKYIILLIVFGICGVFFTSCLEDYLDKSPESGLTSEVVFSKYSNFKLFFDAVYEGYKGNIPCNIKCGYPLYHDMWPPAATMCMLTDMSDEGLLEWAQTFKLGNIAGMVKIFTYAEQGKTAWRPILESMFTVIRICNITLQNVDLLQDASQEDKYDLIAQAHFIRAYAHFTLFRYWGPMPYITKPLGVGDQWDIPRLSKHETCLQIAADMDSAAVFFEKAGVMRRDPGPGAPGHLNSPDQHRPNGVAAKAMKARALLYAASPLNNELGTKDWEEAAKANWEAIKIAEQYQYALLTAENYKLNYVGANYTNEQLWGWYAGEWAYNNGNLKSLINSVFRGAFTAGECPTQNTVDKFETKWGDPLNSQEERDAAAATGHYNEQDPYANRDPRLYIDVIHNQAPLIGYGKAHIYHEIVNGVPVYAELLRETYQGITYTGYYQRKRWGDQSVKNKVTAKNSDPLIRLGELYLNYAEAANEAYGPNTPAPGAAMSAVQAINTIRNRIGMPDVLPKYTGSTEAFRPRIKNERTIELCFEGGHYYWDIRRWKDAPVVNTGPLMGIVIQKVPVSSEYPIGFKHTRAPLPANRQIVWKEAMYYFPFDAKDYYKMKNFVPNEYW